MRGMMTRLNNVYRSWRQRREARRISRDLRGAGYTLHDLERLARLSDNLGIRPACARPSLADVLAAWPKDFHREHAG